MKEFFERYDRFIFKAMIGLTVICYSLLVLVILKILMKF